MTDPDASPEPDEIADARDLCLLDCLDGLSVGDAFGQRFFLETDAAARAAIVQRALPEAPWAFTDDTVMATAVTRELCEHGEIVGASLAQRFATLYAADPSRGYGGTAHGILQAIGRGESWKAVAREAFSGMGSMGNGAAMRAAPVGAFFAGDIESTVRHARRSAAVTHAHTEGRAGAIAVAVAAYMTATAALDEIPVTGQEVLTAVIERTPPSETRDGVRRARTVPFDLSGRSAAAVLGNGSRLLAQDTVPFAIWAAAGHMDNYVEALWTTVDGLGDRDTTCAIVGGIVAAGTPQIGIPPAWLNAREPLDALLLD